MDLRRPRRTLRFLRLACAAVTLILGTAAAWERFENIELRRVGTLFETSLETLREKPVGKTFAVVGDTGSGGAAFQTLFSQIVRERPDFLVVLGDINYRSIGHYTIFRDSLPADLPVFAVPSNHDRKIDPELEVFEALIGPARATFTRGGARFFLLDTSRETIPEDDRAWLLEALRVAGPGPKFVLTHIPPYDPTHPGGPPRTRHSLWDPESAAWLVETAAREGVTAIFTGHWHGFYPTEFSGVPCIVTGGGGYEPDSGQIPHFLLVPLDGDLSRMRKIDMGSASMAQTLAWATDFEFEDFSDRFAPFAAAGTAIAWFLLTILLRRARFRPALVGQPAGLRSLSS